MSERIERRAERLGVLLLALGEEPTVELKDAFAARLVPRGWYTLMTDDAELGLEPGDLALDVDLAMACAAVGKERRARQWDALERLGAAWATGEGDAEERIASMDEGAVRSALLAAYQLGWNFEAPREE